MHCFRRCFELSLYQYIPLKTTQKPRGRFITPIHHHFVYKKSQLTLRNLNRRSAVCSICRDNLYLALDCLQERDVNDLFVIVFLSLWLFYYICTLIWTAITLENPSTYWCLMTRLDHHILIRTPMLECPAWNKHLEWIKLAVYDVQDVHIYVKWRL